MNAIRVLKQDHKKVRDLFRRFGRAGDNAHAGKRKIVESICQELEIHTRIEEELFYPAVQSAGGKRGDDLVAEAAEEHQVAEDLIGRLKEMTPEDEDYDASFKVLKEAVEHHIKEEEGQMFPFTERHVNAADLEALGKQIAARKEALLEPGPLTKAKNFVTDAIEALTGNGSARRAKAPRRSRPATKRAVAKTGRARTRRAGSGRKTTARSKGVARKVATQTVAARKPKKATKRKSR